MLLNNGSMIKMDVIEAFNTAVANPENINSSGGINWDYVDSDLQMTVGNIYNWVYLGECFEVLVDNYFSKK